MFEVSASFEIRSGQDAPVPCPIPVLPAATRLAYLGDQGALAFSAFHAATRAGGCFTPVSPAWPLARLCHYLERARPGGLLLDPGLLDPSHDMPWTLDALRTQLPCPVWTSLDEVVQAAERVPTQPTPDIAALLPTSGSTGEPKCVALPAATLARSAGLGMTVFGWQAGERLVNLADMHTMSGLRNPLLVAAGLGMHWLPVGQAARRASLTLLQAVLEAQAHRLVVAPVLLRQINLMHRRFPRELFSTVRSIHCTGADLSPQEVERFMDRYGVPVLNYYGMTETAGLCIAQPQQQGQQQGQGPARLDAGSIGRACGCGLRAVDDAGNVLAPGHTGELQVLLPEPRPYYLDDAGATASLYSDDGWLCTGDLARIEHGGDVYLEGRKAEYINLQSTEKLSPVAIENILLAHPDIADAAAFGESDAGCGEVVAVLVVLREGCEPLPPAAVAGLIAQQLGESCKPRRVCYVTRIPRGNHGKILRNQLRSLAHD